MYKRKGAALPDLTRAERQLATHILGHYPVSALGSITALAKAAEVSTPTGVRLVQNLGYTGPVSYTPLTLPNKRGAHNSGDARSVLTNKRLAITSHLVKLFFFHAEDGKRDSP